MFDFLKKIDKNLKYSLLNEIERLSPWYQPIDFGYGIKTTAVNKKGRKVFFNSQDRGIKKWHRFIKPSLPFDLNGKTVLDCGCNAGLFLVQACREGAARAFGIEVDDRYYKQAEFTIKAFSKLDKKDYPIEIFKSSFEEFDFESQGKVDLVLFLNTIYHIGKATHANGTEDEIRQIQSEMVKRIGKSSRYIMFQANPREDQGRGKGRESLHNIITKAGFDIYKEFTYNHPRGLITIVRT